MIMIIYKKWKDGCTRFSGILISICSPTFNKVTRLLTVIVQEMYRQSVYTGQHNTHYMYSVTTFLKWPIKDANVLDKKDAVQYTVQYTTQYELQLLYFKVLKLPMQNSYTITTVRTQWSVWNTKCHVTYTISTFLRGPVISYWIC